MFIREDIISLTVPYVILQETKSEYIVQLVVTPEMVPPGFDETPPKLLIETVEQISLPLQEGLSCNYQRGWFLLNGTKQTSYHYLKRVREINKIITDQ